ncbi:MAG: hypothetical protein ACO3RU_02535 [Planctomycetota bacterium]|jgi:hypothetical protein
MRPSLAVVLVLLLAGAITAQGAEQPGSTREWIRKEIEAKEKAMREGKVVRSNVRITVRLQNGSRLRGVVKNGRFIEKHDGLIFVPSERVSEGAGLRLWYYDQTNSYIFLPWGTIAEHTIGEVLTDEDVTKMGLELDRQARVARGVPKNADKGETDGGEGEAKSADATPPAAPPGGGVVPQEPAKPVSKLTPAQKALLTEFPPSAGWGLEKLKALELRKIQVNVWPNEQEKRFIDSFGAWNEAFRIQQEEAEAGGELVRGPVVQVPPKTEGAEPRARRSDRRERRR